MDRLGPAGCREQRNKIIGWLRAASKLATWSQTLTAATKGIGIIPANHWSDPLPWIVDEAIRRADEKQSTDRSCSHGLHRPESDVRP